MQCGTERGDEMVMVKPLSLLLNHLVGTEDRINAVKREMENLLQQRRAAQEQLTQLQTEYIELTRAIAILEEVWTLTIPWLSWKRSAGG